MVEPLPKQQEDEYREAFRFFDKEKSGRIPAKDVSALFRSLGELLTEGQLQQICSGGSLDENSFLRYFHQKWERAQAYDELVNAFRFFDYEGSGYVNGQQLRRVLTTLGDPLTDQEVDEMIRDAGGEQINYQQFVVSLLTKTT